MLILQVIDDEPEVVPPVETRDRRMERVEELQGARNEDCVYFLNAVLLYALVCSMLHFL